MRLTLLPVLLSLPLTQSYHHHHHRHSRSPRAALATFELTVPPGLEALTRYVCPASAGTDGVFRRQDQTVSIPISEVQAILSALQALESQFTPLLPDPPSPSSVPDMNVVTPPFPTNSATVITPPPFPLNDTANSTGVIAGTGSSPRFNSSSRSNVAVYFAQTPATASTSLLAQCADPSIDIAILAFIVSYPAQGSAFPSVNFGPACGGQTPLMAQSAPGLMSCPELAAQIDTCQRVWRKKVFVSIGGSTGDVILPSPEVATSFADVLWKVFGPAGQIADGYRVFGNVSIDGFDIDNESRQPQNYDVLAVQLRKRFSSSPKKRYYLSSAPQCPFPDASNPATVLKLCDFVWVQFYNNPTCEIGSPGFEASVRQWSSSLAMGNNRTRFYVGAPSFEGGAQSAYLGFGGVSGMGALAAKVKSFGLVNLGGLAFWDGPEGRANIEDGRSILDYAKSGLTI